MRVGLILFSLVTVIILLTGCATTEPKPTSGVVGFGKDYQIGSVAPDIPFVSVQGKRTSFRKVSQPIAILAFTSSTGEACCRLVPDLVTLASRFKNYPITVAQISLPTSECSHGPGCTEVCNIDDAHLVSLCDADRIAWIAYGRPKPDTVFLINNNNKIIAIESISNLESIAKEAERLAYELEEIGSPMDEG